MRGDPLVDIMPLSRPQGPSAPIKRCLVVIKRGNVFRGGADSGQAVISSIYAVSQQSLITARSAQGVQHMFPSSAAVAAAAAAAVVVSSGFPSDHTFPCGPGANQEPPASGLASTAGDVPLPGPTDAAAGWLPGLSGLTGLFDLMRPLLEDQAAPGWENMVDMHVPEIPSADPSSGVKGGSGGYSGAPGSGGYSAPPCCWRCAAAQSLRNHAPFMTPVLLDWLASEPGQSNHTQTTIE